MAYEYKKLGEVDVVDYVTEESTLLIEEEGEIKRTPVSNFTSDVEQVQADWNEEDSDSPAFILNKPKTMGGSEVIIYSVNSGALYSQYGDPVDGGEVLDAYERGAIMRVAVVDNPDPTMGCVLGVRAYTDDGGSGSAYTCQVSYFNGTSISSVDVM